MKNMSTGTGLALLAAAIVAYPFANSLAPNANANAVGVGSVAPAIAAAVLAQDPPAPTIVWYGTIWDPTGNGRVRVLRAWTDGRLEARAYQGIQSDCNLLTECGPWTVISSPAEGLTFNADLNFDEAVDGADLGELLAKWGPAPRNPVPPSDCPLALINP
jgi:hypothetical protein